MKSKTVSSITRARLKLNPLIKTLREDAKNDSLGSKNLSTVLNAASTKCKPGVKTDEQPRNNLKRFTILVSRQMSEIRSRILKLEYNIKYTVCKDTDRSSEVCTTCIIKIIEMLYELNKEQ